MVFTSSGWKSVHFYTSTKDFPRVHLIGLTQIKKRYCLKNSKNDNCKSTFLTLIKASTLHHGQVRTNGLNSYNTFITQESKTWYQACICINIAILLSIVVSY